MLKQTLFILILLLAPSLAQSRDMPDHNCIPVVEPTVLAFPARVVFVADGDTITVEPVDGGDRIKIRLYGIDCPETNQPFGSAAKDFVTKLTLYKTVDIDVKDRDQYGRTVAVVTLGNGDILQELLLENGLAWVYPQYCKNCSQWNLIQKTAKLNKKGLWKDKNPIPPWKWKNEEK